MILQRDVWTCQECGARKPPLHVHHTEYQEGRAPWEYADEALLTLCKGCHKSRHGQHGEWVRVYQRVLRQVVREPAMTLQPLRVLLYLLSQQGYGRGLVLNQGYVAEALGMPRSNVSRALRELRRQGWVSRTRTPTGAVLYCVSSRLAQKGQTGNGKERTRG